MKYEKRGSELCRIAIARGNEENSDWINTIVGLYYNYQNDNEWHYHIGETEEEKHKRNEGRYSILAIIEDLLENFINFGSMPDTDIDLCIGFTKESRAQFDARAKEFFEQERII